MVNINKIKKSITKGLMKPINFLKGVIEIIKEEIEKIFQIFEDIGKSFLYLILLIPLIWLISFFMSTAGQPVLNWLLNGKISDFPNIFKYT